MPRVQQRRVAGTAARSSKRANSRSPWRCRKRWALGWSSCFGQAILLLAKKHGVDGSAAKVTCAVELDKDATSFALKAEIAVSIPGADKAKVKALVDEAHQICPYSKATRNNIPVTLSVV